ncbi:hypothetical protein [Pedobacter caeni]|uniref:Uncharacterized protein n=1 Tax=Pedobacter caeni TaxID=288992 RepID=A0A1M5F678_9SPHI|nr:hypothetical protein [Pedobacter caeni]SHF86888.1 hypothetical protein SAMN04488522_103948 [Pedobacter caeni]
MPRGIKHCYFKTNDGQPYLVEKGRIYYVDANDKIEFYVDETCMEEGTVNKKTSVSGARWAMIYHGLFSEVEKMETGTSLLWGNVGTGSEAVNKWGIGTRYKTGSSFKIAPVDSTYYYGYAQRVELFSYTPGSGFYFYVVPIAKPSINFAYFNDSEKVRHYGETIKLLLLYHGYNLDDHNTYLTKIYLLDEQQATGLTTTRDFESKNLWKEAKSLIISRTGKYSYFGKGAAGNGNFNCTFSFSFIIDIDWKQGQTQKKDFTVAVEIYKKKLGKDGKDDPEKMERVAYRNFKTEPTTDLYQYDKTLLKIEDLDNSKSTSSRFMVSEELMDKYMDRVEREKKNQIQYIGDIRYTRKQFDPCCFTTITLKCEDTETVIFDENLPPDRIDETAKPFDIIAGDEKKEISIKLGGLSTEPDACQGLLLNDGEKHSDQKNVFQLGTVNSALREANGTYITVADPGQKDDLDVVIDPNKDPSQSVKDTQKWELGRDYKFKGKDETVLMLGYMYNKTFAESTQDDRNPVLNTARNLLWLFNYFLLTDDKVQTYYLPISTCRYPNQIAKVRVFPNIEWEIAFMITKGSAYSGKVRYQRDRMNAYHQGFGFKYLRDELQVDATKTETVGWALKGVCVENGNEHSLSLENVKKTVDRAIYAFNMVYENLQDLNPENGVGESAAVSKKVLNIDFNIDPPNMGFALGWKYGMASTKEVVPVFTGGLRADPLIGLTIAVDLIPLIGKFGLVGKILEWIIDVVEYLTKSDVYITFEIGTAVKANLSLSYNKIDGFDPKGVQKVEVEVVITIKAGCKSNEVVMVPHVNISGATVMESKEKWMVEGAVGSKIIFTEEVGFDRTLGKQFKQSSAIWKPALMTLTVQEFVISKVTYKPSHVKQFELFKEKELYKSEKEYINEK